MQIGVADHSGHGGEPTRPGEPDPRAELGHLRARRRFISALAAGSTLTVLGVLAKVASAQADAQARTALRPDGRARLPPGQRTLNALRPMGGTPSEGGRSSFRLRVHGEVERPFEIDFREFSALPQVELEVDVHCVTGWSMLDARFSGVRIKDLAARAGVRPVARHVIFEAAHGYTANLRLDEALAAHNLIADRHQGEPLARTHGGPARALVPDLYFWKSAKWITGIKFVRLDDPGYWEVRGYHNHADPWTEERYAPGFG